MTTDLSSPYSGAPPAPPSGRRRAVVGVLGVVVLVVGGFLLFHPYSAARTLALLVGLALIIGGCMELGAVWDAARGWGSLVLGALLVIGGLLAAFWPHATLWTIALITGLSLILHGLGRLVLAVVARDEIHHWGWLALAGVVNVAIGILALVWPEATVLVLSLILGAQVLIFGLLLTVYALWPGRSSGGTPALA